MQKEKLKHPINYRRKIRVLYPNELSRFTDVKYGNIMSGSEFI